MSVFRMRVPFGAVLGMFLVLAVIVVYLGYRNEIVNRRSIERHEDAITRIERAYTELADGLREACAVRNRNVTRLNVNLPPEQRLPLDDCSRYP